MTEYIEKKITADEFNYLTESVGWGTRDSALVEEALSLTLYSVCAYQNGKPIGYGRLIGDKTIFVYVQDIMVSPEHQNEGIGTEIMTRITDKICELRKASPTLRAYLGASVGKEQFYKRFGFITRSEAGLGEGMVMIG